MTAKEYLEQVGRLDRLIKSRRQEIAELRAYTDMLGSMQYDGEKVCASRADTGLRLDSLLDKIAKTVAEQEAAIAAHGEKICEISAAIAEIGDCELGLCLTLRYINLLKWKEIAQLMGISERQVSRLHKRALAELRVPQGE